MRIGIIALLHESNTFVRQTTSLRQFRQDLFLTGEEVREQLSASHHEVGGFFQGLEQTQTANDVQPIPLAAFRATPSGIIARDAFQTLSDLVCNAIASAAKLDGLLVAAHGAAVSESFPDADGIWLQRIRDALGPTKPLIATLDNHANLSPEMVASCDALIAYRTNPHLDQRSRGAEAAELMLATLRGEVQPTMAASFPPLAISIDRQCTDDEHWQTVIEYADAQLANHDVVSNSLLLGFPYADVPEMGAAAIVVTNDDAALADELAQDLGNQVWQSREQMRGQLLSVPDAIELSQSDTNNRICLLDMGDNVGGGSAGDGTVLVEALMYARLGPSLACLYDPAAVACCVEIGIGNETELIIGGKTDHQHGKPLTVRVRIVSICDGKFVEEQARHGGIVEFDQGATCVVDVIGRPMTLILNSQRTAPFSLNQVISCGVDPLDCRILVAKGVNAPIAAYREVCSRFLRVNTIGSTCADMTRLEFHHRRKPLFPFEEFD